MVHLIPRTGLIHGEQLYAQVRPERVGAERARRHGRERREGAQEEESAIHVPKIHAVPYFASMTASALPPVAPRRFLGTLLFSVVVGITFTTAWWLGSPRALGWALAGGLGSIPVAWLLGRLLRSRPGLALAIGVLLIHVAAGVAGGLGGLPWIELLKFTLQGTLLGAAAGIRIERGAVPSWQGIATVALPLILAVLARQQVALEIAEGIRLQDVLAASIARGSAFPDSSEVGAHTRIWVVDRETARIVASPDHKAGDLGDLGLEHPGRMLTEAGGAYATRLSRHAVVAWRAVPGRNDVGVAVIVYEPTSDFDSALGWSLLTLLAVVGAGIVLIGGPFKR
jgi:hypothetical protein